MRREKKRAYFHLLQRNCILDAKIGAGVEGVGSIPGSSFKGRQYIKPVSFLSLESLWGGDCFNTFTYIVYGIHCPKQVRVFFPDNIWVSLNLPSIEAGS